MSAAIKVAVGEHTHVAKFNGHYWPAVPRPEGLVVDFRMFDRGGQNLGYWPDQLRRARVPEHLVLAAGDSDPPGFVLIADAVAAEGRALCKQA